MGEIAEMMLDGSYCSQCACLIDDVLTRDRPPGHPRVCGGCRYENQLREKKPKNKKRVAVRVRR